MSKQTELHRLVMKLQLDHINQLKLWMSEAENKLSIILKADLTKCAVISELTNIVDLLSELDNQQSLVTSISNFILVDSFEDENAGSLEDELSALGVRWMTLCNMCQDRHQLLQTLDTLWRQFSDIAHSLETWMNQVEEKLKSLEIVEDLDKEELTEQGTQVTVSRISLIF